MASKVGQPRHMRTSIIASAHKPNPVTDTLSKMQMGLCTNIQFSTAKHTDFGLPSR